MTATLNIPIDSFYGVLLIFLRVAAIIFSAPILDTATIPVVFKAALAFAVSILLLPVVQTVVTVTNLSLTAFVMGMLSEIIIGVTIGLSVKLVFAGIQMAGQIAGYQMGLAVANVMDPSTMAQIPILAQIYNLTAMLIFLAIDAHHMFFSALVDSYRIIPPLSIVLSSKLVEMMMDLAGNMFVVAIKVGAPLIAVLLVTTIALGLVARTVPQMHIFVVAMPLKIVLGLVFMMIVAPFLTAFLIDMFSSYRFNLYKLLHLMALR
jgi:flagellar biosynthesis protein FliR